MYTNISNVIDTVIDLLDRNALQINTVVHVYQPDRDMIVFKGMRNTLPADAYPSFEIEPADTSNRWATTRSQRPTYNLDCTLTTRTDNEDLHVEYISTLTRIIVDIMTSPENLQLPVKNETRWDWNAGLVRQEIIDSFVEGVNYGAAHEGTIRKADFTWYALIHEPYPNVKFEMGGSDQPTVLRPNVLEDV